jgi:hypothetical protein
MGYIKKYAAALAAVGLLVGMASSARATITFTPPISVNTPNIVGAANILQSDKASGEISTVQPIAQKLLDLAASYNGTIDGRLYRTSQTDYSGTLLSTPTQKDDNGNVNVPAGWEFVVGKYDGQNAGYILFYLNGQDAVLPAVSYAIWGENSGQYELSSWYAFNPIPEPTTMIAGALLLLPFAASTVRYVRKNRKA